MKLMQSNYDIVSISTEKDSQCTENFFDARAFSTPKCLFLSCFADVLAPTVVFFALRANAVA